MSDIHRSGNMYRSAPLAAPSAFEMYDEEQAHEQKKRKGPVAGGVLYYKPGDKTKIKNPETHRWASVHSHLGEELMMKYGTPVEQMGGTYRRRSPRRSPHSHRGGSNIPSSKKIYKIY